MASGKDPKKRAKVLAWIFKILLLKTQWVTFASEWTEFTVHTYGSSDKDKRKSLRKKMYKHKKNWMS